MNTGMDMSDENMDQTQVAPGQEAAPTANKTKPAMASKKPAKKKKITSISQLRDLAKSMKK